MSQTNDSSLDSSGQTIPPDSSVVITEGMVSEMKLTTLIGDIHGDLLRPISLGNGVLVINNKALAFKTDVTVELPV